jgi:hypothetical protein
MIQVPLESFPVLSRSSHHSSDHTTAASPRFLASLARWQVDRDIEGSPMADNLAHPYNRRKSLLCTGIISERLLTDSMWCRSGVNNRRPPRWRPPSNIRFLCGQWSKSRSHYGSHERTKNEKEYRVVAIVGTRVSTVEMPCFRINTSPESATVLQTRKICKEVPGCLASLASPH